jgi:hypothetical protein
MDPAREPRKANPPTPLETKKKNSGFAAVVLDSYST